jgi:protein-tyrosine phosphatase
MRDYDQILPELWVGACPQTPKDVDRLSRRVGITAVVNLQTDEDFVRLTIDWPKVEQRYRDCGVEIRRVQVTDFDAVDLRFKLPNAVQAVDELIRAGHTTYLHCTLGVGRAPSVAISYLAWCRDWGLDEAWHHVKTQRDCAPSFEAIWLASRERTGQGQG